MNFQVETIDDVFRNWHFLVEHGVEIEMGPGRHPQSGAIFLYFLGPEGFTYEYSFGVRRIEDDASWGPGPSTRPSQARSTCGSAPPPAPSPSPSSGQQSSGGAPASRAPARAPVLPAGRTGHPAS